MTYADGEPVAKKVNFMVINCQLKPFCINQDLKFGNMESHMFKVEFNILNGSLQKEN